MTFCHFNFIPLRHILHTLTVLIVPWQTFVSSVSHHFLGWKDEETRIIFKIIAWSCSNLVEGGIFRIWTQIHKKVSTMSSWRQDDGHLNTWGKIVWKSLWRDFDVISCLKRLKICTWSWLCLRKPSNKIECFMIWFYFGIWRRINTFCRFLRGSSEFHLINSLLKSRQHRSVGFHSTDFVVLLQGDAVDCMNVKLLSNWE